MGSIFRSEELTLCQIFLSTEAAYNCVSELGELGLVQFRDLNSSVNAFQRKFVNEVRRADEMERKLRFIQSEITKASIDIADDQEDPDAPQHKEVIDMEATFEKLERELIEINENASTLNNNYLELVELKGNVIIKQMEIETPLVDPVTGKEVRKNAFLVFVQGEQLKTRVKRVCEGCRSTLYPCPESDVERQEMLSGVKVRLDELNTVLSQTNEHRHRVLAAASKHIYQWLVKVHKMKGIYHTLNMFSLDVTTKCLIAEGWVPTSDMQRIFLALQSATEKSGSTVNPILNSMEAAGTPPTYYRSNKFTAGFQNLIDAYGVSSYREVNPGLYTIATFPFLFSIMFGDAGHGLLMFLFALWMVLNEVKLMAKKSNSEIWNMFFGGRYIILLMGAFSMYAGLIYNDIFSKSFNIFGSSWHAGNASTDAILHHHAHQHALNPGDVDDYSGTPYPVGLDPAWQLAVNKISFLNSYKMKVSVIIGVVHMLFGVSLSLYNHLYFKRHLNIFCEFIPQVIFLTFLFGYLCFLVFLKWGLYGDGPGSDVVHGSSCAPSVLITFINMALFKDDQVKDVDCESVYMFQGQNIAQKLLLIISVLCIPIMLLVKPYLLRRQHMNQAVAHPTPNSIESGADESSSNEHHGTEFDFGEVFIHQSIHTIEYVLGSISHTASYLRLWALSLAHAQLSDVLWVMVLKIGTAQASTSGAVILYFAFAAWAALTVSILVLMEGLSAFLHTLRLHWVEFCSKFYEGQGVPFRPFCFKFVVLLEKEE